MLFTEMSNSELEKYSKERCEEIENLYENLKQSINGLAFIKDDKERIRLMYDILEEIDKLSNEHVDTLDRYLLAYENDKRLSNLITKLTEMES